MYTQIIFENRSMNPHLPDVTFFQECQDQAAIAWKVIRKCPFL